MNYLPPPGEQECSDTASAAVLAQRLLIIQFFFGGGAHLTSFNFIFHQHRRSDALCGLGEIGRVGRVNWSAGTARGFDNVCRWLT